MKIFLSTPISYFKDKDKLRTYKELIKSFIVKMKQHHTVCSEIEDINDNSDYDTPEKSISDDLNSIKDCDLFILHYPEKIPTSALIELGFAIAYEKRIIIITPHKHILPFLALGIPSQCPSSIIIENEHFDIKLIQKLEKVVENSPSK